MRDFTEEEKQKIISTPITRDVFEMTPPIDTFYDFESDAVLLELECIRQHYIATKNKHYLTRLLELLPNSYKVVKL